MVVEEVPKVKIKVVEDSVTGKVTERTLSVEGRCKRTYSINDDFKVDACVEEFDGPRVNLSNEHLAQLFGQVQRQIDRNHIAMNKQM